MARSTQPQADCEIVMNFGLPLAAEILKRNGEFLPFGAAMRPNREIVCLGAYDGRSYPSLIGSFAELIRSLKEALVEGARRHEYVATALFYEVGFTPPAGGEDVDAVAVSLNHRDGYSVIVLLPYKIEGGEVVYDIPRAQPGEADIFPSR
ncbi:MAG: hypothetical protein JO204_19305 [Alphaproteobacteria bacterium]|nr:hypothetical protein [Alphaproteobacteria bacterium]